MKIIKAWAVIEKDGSLFRYEDCEMDIYASKRAAKECGKKWQMKRKVIPVLITLLQSYRKETKK